MAWIVPFLYPGCAAAYLLLALFVALAGRKRGSGLTLSGAALVTATLLTAAWAAAVATAPETPLAALPGGLELARDAAWYGFGLFLLPPPAPGARPLRRTLLGFGVVVLAIAIGAAIISPASDTGLTLASPAIAARLGFAVANLLLVENLYRNSRPERRWHINLLCIALGALFAYDLVLYGDAVLFRRLSPPLFAGHAIVATGLAPLIALAALRNRKHGITLQVSRSVVFHTTTLVASGLFLLALAAAGEVFRRFGANWGTLAEISLLSGGLVVIAVLASSGSARSRLKSLVVDHFFTTRYDYRREWMRFIAALSTPDPAVALHERVLRATAEVVDSPGGVLFLRAADETGFHWGGSLNLPPAGVMLASDHPLLARLDAGETVVIADPDATPWIEGFPPLWLAVPLVHAERLIGLILLPPPRAPFRLDGEVFTLLRTIGQQVAVFIAEQRATQSLVETRHLREYGQRFAFVAHDIKNVSSQLSLLLANAEFHLDNPDFQRDMLATVRTASTKITALLARLSASEGDAPASAVAPLERIAAIAATLRQSRGVAIAIAPSRHGGKIAMPLEAFDAVITHLLDNALDAEESAGRPGHVQVRISEENSAVVIEISDRGTGMTPDFIRDELFRPFRSSKRTGSGIGAFQARALLQNASGSLHVTSTPGAGTTMRLSLPLLNTPVTA
jgi:putative PEP-CTERM system histidine kinase